MVSKVAPINFFIFILIVMSIGGVGFQLFSQASINLFNNSSLQIFSVIGTIIGIFLGLKLLNVLFPNVKT